MQLTRYTGHVTPPDGIVRRVPVLAINLLDARDAVRSAAVGRFPRQPITFIVRPA